jgi:sulfate adenylyltransferase subunit 1 (EFTu-like GTPase family)
MTSACRSRGRKAGVEDGTLPLAWLLSPHCGNRRRSTPEFDAFATPLGISVSAIPVIATDGGNVVKRSIRTPRRPTLLHWLESVEVARARDAPLRFRLHRITASRAGPRHA